MSDRAAVSIVRRELPVQAGDINDMVREAIGLIGGIDRFVKKGDAVAIKPNLFAPYPPPVSVDRRVIGAIVSLCKEAGAKSIAVIEGLSVGSLIKRVNLDASEKGSMARGIYDPF